MRFFDRFRRRSSKQEAPEEVLSESENRELVDVSSIQRCHQKRGSVSAEVYNENSRKDYRIPNFPKSPEQEKRIRDALQNSFLFSALEDEDLNSLIGAFVEEKVEEGTIVIKQGDQGDKLYLLETGEFEAFKESGNTSEKCGSLLPGDTFGELALMYNAPRAATVSSTVESQVWSLDRETFIHVVRDSVAKRRAKHEEFLSKVEILKDMNSYERAKLSDSLKCQRFEAGSVIIEEGQLGKIFYILESGKATAVKDGEVVQTYGPGDYFGELALLNSKPRAATVKAVEVCHVVYLDEESFTRLLGPVKKILKRNSERYRMFKDEKFV